MRYFKKIDWSISLSVLFVSVLTVIAACVEPSGPLGAPNFIETPTVSSVRITLAQSALAPGQTTQATVVATSADGKVVSGRVDFLSQSPSIATVSSNGVVSAVAAGVAMIQATVAARVATASVTVQSLASPVAVVATVTVAIDSVTLGIGHKAQASATPKDATGTTIVGQPVTWASLTPTVATVLSSGLVTAVAAGSVAIQATVSGVVGSTSIVVMAPNTPPNPDFLASHDFDNGTAGPFTMTADVDFPDDPTGSGHGKVARLLFAPAYKAYGQTSNDKHLRYTSTIHYRYGQTIWFRGQVYLPSTGSAHQAADNRKLLDWYGVGPNSARMILRRDHSGRGLYLSVNDAMGDGVVLERFSVPTGIILDDDTWHTIEVKMVTNSADNVRDGELHIYMNGSPTPTYSRTTGIGWITEQLGGSYFSNFNVGSQLTIQTPTDPVYTEYRYWDNVAFSTTRIGQ